MYMYVINDPPHIFILNNQNSGKIYDDLILKIYRL